MKNLILLLLAFNFMCSLGCKDQNKPSESNPTVITTQSNPLTESEVRNAVRNLNLALVEPKRNNLEDITSKDLTYGHSSGTIQNREEFIDDLINGAFDFLSVDTTDDSIDISGDTAIARHVFWAKGTNKGEPTEVHIGIILTFQKNNGNIKLLARQAYKL